VREASLESKPRGTFYTDYRQRPGKTSTMNIVVQATADPAATMGAVTRVVREVLPDVPPRLRTIETVIAESVADRRFILLLVGVFGGAALLLATLGVYGVIAFLVTQRQQELAVRVALGAQSTDVLRLVLRQGATLALIGVAIGGAAALGLTRLLSGMLYGVSATDPVAFTSVAVLLAGVAIIASWVPARRASRVDPMRILRGG
jgi:putative ABC transport system permease protein